MNQSTNETKLMRELRQENWEDYVEARSKYLRENILFNMGKILKLQSMGKEDQTGDTGELVELIIDKCRKNIKRDLNAIRALQNTETPVIRGSDIERANTYPIRLLIGASAKGNALCPFHDESHPSMGIKRNRYHCFACGEKGDAISMYMHIHNSNFVKAVHGLNKLCDEEGI